LAIKVDIIYNKHILDALKEIPDDSIDTIVTSPPYWGLRDYGEDTKTQWPDDWFGQLGLEPTLDMYIEHLLQVTKELKRVLKLTGVMFWNHGDCWGSSPPGNSKENIEQWANKGDGLIGRKFNRYGDFKKPQSIKQKCLALQNYRLILRMIDEQGWILRNIIIWYKPNAMPSSVKDRFSNRYEPVFMLTKRKKYWFDLDVVRQKYKQTTIERCKYPVGGYGSLVGSQEIRGASKLGARAMFYPEKSIGKNPGDVWAIATQPFPEAHFATFPEKLVEPMIRCACPKWICKKCGKARARITKTEYHNQKIGKTEKYNPKNKMLGTNVTYGRGEVERQTIGWTDCGCNAGFDAGIVLDPFAGAGTTLVVAKRLGRHYIGIEIKKEYCEMAERRLESVVCQEELF